MYCPICLNDTLKIRSSGVAKLTFNGKARSTSLFTFNITKDNITKLNSKLKSTVTDYIAWYASFVNKAPIKNIEIFSGDFICSKKCQIDVNTRISLVDVLYDKTNVNQMLSEVCEEYKIDLDFKFS